MKESIFFGLKSLNLNIEQQRDGHDSSEKSIE
jgi:hypothetical protein